MRLQRKTASAVALLAAATLTVGSCSDRQSFEPDTPPSPLELSATSSSADAVADEVIVRVLDVGQGDATLITNGSSKVIIDGGPSETRFGALLDSIGLNNTTIDAVILSHGHSDHYDGLRQLFRSSRKITIKYFFENGDASTDQGLLTVRDSIYARANRGELIYRDTDDPCGDGTTVCTLSLAGGAKLHIMRPIPDATASVNNRSSPVKLVGPDSASFTMWFGGDAERGAIAWFETGAFYHLLPGMKANVLKSSHHGNCDGFSNRYVELVRPEAVTFSLKAQNSTGLINAQVKDLLARSGASWYRTDQNGTIMIRSPGTPGGGYTITATRGAANSAGPSDAPSTSKKCNPIQ